MLCRCCMSQMDGVAIAQSLLNHNYGQQKVVVPSMITTRHRFKEIELIYQELYLLKKQKTAQQECEKCVTCSRQNLNLLAVGKPKRCGNVSAVKLE
jgi:hypothetical protein